MADIAPPPPAHAPIVVLFDGVCCLCNFWVRFIIRRDRARTFRFAALQSDAGRRVLAGRSLPAPLPDSVVVVDAEGVHFRSDGALRIMRGLPWPWRALGVLRMLPRGARDWVYDVVARHRYRWFGKMDACMVPTSDQRARFLE